MTPPEEHTMPSTTAVEERLETVKRELATSATALSTAHSQLARLEGDFADYRNNVERSRPAMEAQTRQPTDITRRLHEAVTRAETAEHKIATASRHRALRSPLWEGKQQTP